MFLSDANNCRLVIAVLLKRMGGSATITEEDLQEISFQYLDSHECGPDGKLYLAVNKDESYNAAEVH